jgi:hypothetical protein
MKRFFVTAAVAALGFAVLSVTPIFAEGGSHGGSGHHNSGGERHREFRPSERFGYDRHGFRSFSWSHSRWSEYYHRYCYWSPGYGWYFYEPVHSCYLPISCYGEVYPEFTPSLSTPVATAPVVTQQTTVVTAPTPPVVGGPQPPPIPTLPNPAAAVQKTNVGAALP